MRQESKTTEFKREYTDDLKYAVVAFANTDGGKIYIGINDDGTPNVEAGEVGNFIAGTADDDLHVKSNAWFWQVFVSYDNWADLKKPMIRITMKDDEVSANAEFELGYAKAVDKGNTMNKFSHEEYVGKCLTLSEKKLPVKPWLMLSSPTPEASIVKIEILDIIEE